MLKFLRKYQNWILVIGGILLMIAFTAPQAIQQLGPTPDSIAVATVDGDEVKLTEMRRVQGEIRTLREMAPNFMQLLLGNEEDEATHWLLLTREARAAGFVGEGGDGDAWLPALAEIEATLAVPPELRSLAGQIFSNPQWQQMFNIATPEQHLRAMRTYGPGIAARADLDAREYDAMLSHVRGVLRMMDAYGGAARLSTRRAIIKGREARDGAYVDYVFLPASLLAGGIPEPDDEALRAHYERFKDVRPGEGEYGIGYKDPQRVKLAWLTLDRGAILAAVEPDLIEVQKRWRQNKARYGEDFDAARPAIENEIRRETADRILQEAQLVIEQEVLKTTRRLESDGRYKKLPADWAPPSLEQIAQQIVDRISESHGVTIPLPAVTIKNDAWVTPMDVQSLPGIGQSQFRQGGLVAGAADLIFAVRELGNQTRLTSPVQVGVPLTDPLIDAAENRYFVTVLAAQTESPQPLEDIRDRVAQDYKSLQAFEQLAGRVDELRGLAAAQGLEAAVDLLSPPPPATPDGQPAPEAADRPQVQRQVFVNHTNPQVPALAPEPILDLIVERAETIDPLAPPESIDAQAGTVAAAIPGQLGVTIARITAVRPLTQEAYRAEHDQLVQQARNNELAALTESWSREAFSLEQLKKRHRYRQLDERGDEIAPEAPAGEGPDQSKETAGR